MRFPVVFYRQVGGGLAAPFDACPALGDDAAPAPLASAGGATIPVPVPTPQQPSTTAKLNDCVLRTPSRDKYGHAVQRIAAFYGYAGGGAAPALTGTMYALEETTGLWLLVGTAATTLVVGGLTFWDAHAISEPAQFDGSTPGMLPGAAVQRADSSSLQYFLRVLKVGNVNGAYYFGMAPILTSSP